MQNLQEFINRWNGKYLDYDHNSGPQCVDLVKQWAHDNGKPVIRGNAIVWKKAPGYTWVANTPTNAPRAGDIVVFNIGKYGHVAVAQSSGTHDLVSFDQNWPIGQPCKTVIHRNYAGVIGWLKI